MNNSTECLSREDIKFSILMAAYNAEKYIAEAIESVRKQSYENWELIIVNDCSIDSTKEIVTRYAHEDDRIRVLQTDMNSGAPWMPRLIGLENARYNYITYLDADDTFGLDFLSILTTRILETEADGILCYGAPSLKDIVAEGKDCVKYTLNGFEISAGYCFSKDVYLKAISSLRDFEFQAWKDEFSTKALIYGSNRISFVPSRYNYRSNPESVTNEISANRFVRVYGNVWLKSWVYKNYGADALERKLVNLQLFNDLMFFVRLYSEHVNELQNAKEDINNYFLSAHNSIEWNLIRGHVRWYQYLLMRVHPIVYRYIITSYRKLKSLKKK